jgi:hypothetical protein
MDIFVLAPQQYLRGIYQSLYNPANPEIVSPARAHASNLYNFRSPWFYNPPPPPWSPLPDLDWYVSALIYRGHKNQFRPLTKKAHSPSPPPPEHGQT